MIINGLEVSKDDFAELQYLVAWKVEDIEECFKDEYYEEHEEELLELKRDYEAFLRIGEFLSELKQVSGGANEE